MLKTGREHLEGLRDGRVVYIGGERVADVTAHPAFRNAAETVARLYDLKRDPAQRDVLSFEEGGERYSTYFLLPKTRDDLVRRMRAHKAIADATYGLFGRSPDHVPSFVAGLALQPDVFEDGSSRPYRENLLAYYRRARARDTYVTYAVLPPQGTRDPEFSQRENFRTPALAVVAEDDAGVRISGIKTLATGAIFSDEIWLGNVQPIAKGQEAQAITCVVPVNAKGLSLWSRRTFEDHVPSEFDAPLSARFDESDSVVVCEDVHVPWENIFVHNQAALSREIYIRTPSHCFGNHQSNVRFWSKLQLLVALAHRAASLNGTLKIAGVQETLGRLAAFEAAISGMVHGQCMDHEDLGNGYVSFNRRIMYGALDWCTDNYPLITGAVRELLGSSPFMMPADVSVMDNPEARRMFETYWAAPGQSAIERMKVFKLAWDLLGSEFGGRHMQYEKFYAGPSFIVRNHSFRECPWEGFGRTLDGLLASYDRPGVPAR
ncbi:MAG: 4-hydroxyphenylacetate 3-hydroxylase N-terminal domain-containing protein [Alphaproteobacteria bacterium]